MSDDVEKVDTPRGNGARSMTPLSPYDVRMSFAPQNYTPATGTGADWMGPSQPIQPIAPPEVAGRQWDFVPGFNLATTPRAYEEVTFPTLRALAASFDPLRLIIERRKDQMCRLPWTIRVRHDNTRKKHPALQDLPAGKQKLIADVTAFFKKPDGELTFRAWLRSLLEDLLVIDAPTLYCERNRGGDLIGLMITDGSIIKRVIDDWGRTPRPIPWTGQPFFWNNRIEITLENHQAYGFKLLPSDMVAHQLPRGVSVPKLVMMPPAYQLVLKNMPAVNYTTWDMLYRPMNLRPRHPYGFSPVEQIVTTVSIAMRRAYSQLEYFREGNQPEAIWSLPEDWSPDQTQRFQDYWDNLFVGNLGMRRRMKFIPGGSGQNYTAVKEPPLKNEFDEWLTRIVCFAFSYPPQAFVALSNRSTAEQHERTAEEEGLDPLKQWAIELFNDVIAREFSDELEFAWIEENEVDQAIQAEILTKYTDSGVLTRNQARERIGEEPDPNPAADELMVTTGTGLIPIGANLLDNKVAEAKAMAQAVPPPAPTPAKTGGPKPLKEEA